MIEKFGHKIHPGEIIIKDVNVLIGLMERNFFPLLIIIICEIIKKYGSVITESYREKKHKNDLHGTIPVRAIDLRFWCYETEQVAYEIMHWINRTWKYDPDRPEKLVSIIHKTKQGALHFHIQVSDKTIRKSYII